jgi:DNA processing protein
MSEFPLGAKPDARNFPRRNRILSGLSLGVLVVEAPLDSGVMHTVRFALEQGRDVFTIPGSIFSTSSLGSNRLIQDGAKLVTDAADVLEELNISRLEQQPSLPGFSPVEEVEGEEAG